MENSGHLELIVLDPPTLVKVGGAFSSLMKGPQPFLWSSSPESTPASRSEIFRSPNRVLNSTVVATIDSQNSSIFLRERINPIWIQIRLGGTNKTISFYPKHYAHNTSLIWTKIWTSMNIISIVKLDPPKKIWLRVVWVPAKMGE